MISCRGDLSGVRLYALTYDIEFKSASTGEVAVDHFIDLSFDLDEIKKEMDAKSARRFKNKKIHTLFLVEEAPKLSAVASIGRSKALGIKRGR